ncbi:MAG TPA: ABC transporter substrate-binding protein [Candidatus Tectomicrobia bacterium]|nr:ABC transporter substrate-binding protein [Candidatus Tectomicrobia bacterium]
MCDLDRRTFLGAVVAGAAALAGEFVYGGRAHAQGAPIKIGAPLPLTGPAAPLGQHSLWGTQAALRVIERRGGIAGRPVQLLVEDDGGRPADAVRIMRKMILQDKVDAIIGGASSVDTVPMLPVAQETETLLLVTVAESDVITADKCNRYTFRLTPDARAKARAMAPFLTSRVARKWQFLYWDNAYGQSMLKWFTEELQKSGGEVTQGIPIPAGTTDYSSYLAKLRPASEAPGLFHSVAGSDAVRLGKHIGEFGLQKQYRIAGTCDVIFPETFDEQARDLEGAYIVEQYPVKEMAPLDTPADRDFRKVFLEVSRGVPAGPHSYASYQSTFIFKRAVEASGYQTRKDTLKAVQAIEGMAGQKSLEFPQGPFTMRKEDHQGLLNLYIWQLRNAQAHMLSVVTAAESGYPPSAACKM